MVKVFIIPSESTTWFYKIGNDFTEWTIGNGRLHEYEDTIEYYHKTKKKIIVLFEFAE